MLGISNFGGKEWQAAQGKGRRQGVNDPQTLKHSFDFQQTSDASFSAAPIRSCIPAFHDNSAISFPLFRVVYPPDFDVDADDHFRLYLETQFRGELCRNPGDRRTG